MTLLLDTSVALRALPRQGVARIREFLNQRVQGGDELIIAPQVLYEFWVVATRPADVNGLGLSTRDAAAEVRDLIDTHVLLPDPPDLPVRWLALCEKVGASGKPSHDARLVAFMLTHRIEGIVTLNPGDFVRYPDIQIFAP